MLVVLAAGSAQALCIYKSQLYVKITMDQEFADSRSVVKATVIAESDDWPYNGDPWIIYHLRVLNTFKNIPQIHIDLFTWRNSGGFYLERGAEYLLYLNPVNAHDKAPSTALSALEVNYACGQSKPWANVAPADRQRLAELSGAR